MSPGLIKLFSRIQGLAGRAERWGFIQLFAIFSAGELAPKEAEEGSYIEKPAERDDAWIDATHGGSELVLTIAQQDFEESSSRLTVLTSKVTSLQTVTGVILSGVIATVSFSGVPKSVGFAVLLITFLAVLLCTLWFLLRFLRVGKVSMPSLDAATYARRTEPTQRRALIKDLLTATELNGDRMRFLVDVYRGGRNAFVLALLLGVSVAGWALLAGSKVEIRVMDRLRADKEMREILRGPAGKDGAAGRDGMPGAAGPAGASGPQGEPGRTFFPPVEIKSFDARWAPLNPRLQPSLPSGNP